MNWHSIGIRAVLGIATLMLVLGSGLLFAYAQAERNRVIEMEIQSARSLLMTAEAVRDHMSDKWRSKVLTPALLREYAQIPDEAERRKLIIAAVPVATAWGAIREHAHESNFELRVPRQNPRNPKNTPDAQEQAALDYFASHAEANELVRVDDQINAIRYYRPVRLGQECLACHGDPSNAKALWDNDQGVDILGYPMENKKLGDLHGAFEIVKPLDTAQALLNRQLWFTAAILSVALIGVCSLSFVVIKRQIVDPFTILGLRLEDMAQGDGDLTKRLKVKGKTEVAWLSHSFNQFIAKVQKTVTEIIRSGEKIAGQSENLMQVTASLTRGVSEQQNGTKQAKHAMRAMIENVENIADNASTTAEAAREADQEAQAGFEMMTEVKQAIDQLANEVERGAHVIHELNEYSANIGSVIDVIRSIAEQTNLLALNAAIEAARAGEQGRGFAVVADEVRVLASRTQQSTQEIQNTIQRLQETAKKAALVMAENQNRAVLSVEKASAAGDKLERIHSMVNTITQKNAHIAEAAEAQNRMSQNIDQNIERISQMVATTAIEAEHTEDVSRLLSQLGEDLSSAISYFKT